MSTVLIIGAKSDIAKAIAREYAKQGYDLYLAARHSMTLTTFAADIRLRYNRRVKCIELDILDYPAHERFFAALDEKPAGAISVVGLLGDQINAQHDFNATQQIIDTNFTGVVSLLNIIANHFEQTGHGFIVGITSVAGDRGRKSNYIYGSAKAALTVYLSGLRNRLYASGVQVLTVKPGFVDTAMTKDMNLPERLTAQPDEVASDIFDAQQKGKNILYTRWFWRYIMLIINALPEALFKRMNL